MLKLISKKGQIESYIYIIISLFIIGVFLFFVNTFNNHLYDSFDKYFNQTSDYNQSLARTTTETIKDVENSYYDYIFLAVLIGFILQMCILSYLTRINIAFFWIFVIIGGVGLFVGVMLSNTWQEISVSPEFSETIVRFPITNALLGTYYPTIVTGIMLIIIIFIFGKPNEATQ